MRARIFASATHTLAGRAIIVLLLCALCLAAWLLVPILAEPFTGGEFPFLLNGLVVLGVLTALETGLGWLDSPHHPG